MLISDRKTFIFVHIYKTGGSSVTRLLGPYVDRRYRAPVTRVEGDGWQGTWHYGGRQHARLHELRADPLWTERDMTTYRICTIVRNPYTWALSVWNDFYRTESGGPQPWFSTLYPSRTFQEYCRFIRAAALGLNPNVWGSHSQRSFIADPELRPAFVGRFERLQEDVAAMMRLLELPVQPLPHECVSDPGERADIWSFYDDECLATINEIFSEDFDAFGYERLTTVPQPAGHRTES